MQHLSLKFKALPILALSFLFIIPTIAFQSAQAATTTSPDFSAQSFSKTVDWYDYVRQYAAANNLPQPNASEHAYVYTNYINVGGFQLFYTGLVNATHNGQFVTIPLQTFFEHYKTIGGKDAITASSFISLVAFNESNTDPYPNSPDKSDTVYASFNLGVNLTQITGHKFPSYIASSSIIPLTQTDASHWSWGLIYTNLNAIWWKINPDPFFPTADLVQPRGFAMYSQLAFNYALAIDPASKTATLTTSYTAVTSATSDGDKVFKADFGVKSTYQLYNYTLDSSETTSSTNNINVRTVNVKAWAGNPVFWFQNRFMGFLPLFVANVDPGLITQARQGLLDFTVSDYLYIISYPTWGGYKIVHDPDYTAFYTPANNVGLLTAIFLAVAVAAGVGGLFAFLFRKRRAAGIAVSGAGTTGPSPTQDPTPSGPLIPGR